MFKPSACIGIGALAVAIAMPAAPARAQGGFGLRVGPLHLRLPVPGMHSTRHRAAPSHRRARHAAPAKPAAEPRSATALAPAARETAGRTPALLYPALGWAPVYTGIFSPAGASWPFGFTTIFEAAFGEPPQAQAAARSCAQAAVPDDLIGRIRQTVRPNEAQRPAMQELTAAAAQANGYLRQTCAQQVPEDPVARLKFMQSQVDTTLMALEIMRLPLQKFEQSLADEQRVRLAAAFANRQTADCAAAADAPKWPIAAIGEAVQPSDTQRRALEQVQAAAARAASALEALCQTELPASPLARLEAVEARLDATWRAVQTMQVALASFRGELNDDQRRRFDALDLAALQQQG
jgi:hypothetical protein